MTGCKELTRALVAPPSGSIDDGVRARVRDRLTSGFGPHVDRLPAGESVMVTTALLRRARDRPDSLSEQDEPFAWSPLFVRRSLGLAVVSACARGCFRTPAEAVGPVAAEAVAEWERTGWRAFHWEPWLAGLTSGARAMVLAEAVNWAIGLWSSLDWDEFPRLPRIGGADDWWMCPASRTVRLKGRSELHVPLVTGRSRASEIARPGGSVALVSVSGACPGDGWPEELAFLALVAAASSVPKPIPVRVVGLWPDAGMHATMEIDAQALMSAAERVVTTVAAVVDARLSSAARQ
jgi:hypothetical protein